PYLKIVCVWPPQTSISLSGGAPVRAESRAVFSASRSAVLPFRDLSMYFLTSPPQPLSSEICSAHYFFFSLPGFFDLVTVPRASASGGAPGQPLADARGTVPMSRGLI